MKRPHAHAFPGKGHKSGYKRHNKGGWKQVAADAASKYGPAAIGAAAALLRSGNTKSDATFNPLSSPASTSTFRGRAGVVKQDGMGGSVSKCIFYKKQEYISKTAKELLGRYVTELNGPVQISSGVGRQNAGEPITLFDNGAITTMIENGPEYNSSVQNPTKIYLESVQGEMLMTNTRSANVFVTIYDIISRHDCNLSAFQTPAGAWSSGETTQGSAITTQGALPYNSEAFNQFYKVIQTTEFILAEGACHKHLFYAAPNRTWSSLRCAGNITNGPFGDVSCFVMVVIRGAPANDSTTKTSVSSGAATIDLVVDYAYHYRFPRSTLAVISDVVNLPQSFAVGEEVLNEAIGVASSNTQA